MCGVPSARQALAQSSGRLVPVAEAVLEDPNPADWHRWRRTLDGWGSGLLDQIDRDYIRDLRMVWSRAFGPGLQRGAPLVHDGPMYMPGPCDVIQTIDGATGLRHGPPPVPSSRCQRDLSLLGSASAASKGPGSFAVFGLCERFAPTHARPAFSTRLVKSNRPRQRSSAPVTEGVCMRWRGGGNAATAIESAQIVTEHQQQRQPAQSGPDY